MKKGILITALCLVFTIAPTQKSHAIVWEIVRQALIAAIKAADLAVQRLQNKTIWLQNAQKALENVLSKVKLDEISDWVDKHKKQYEQYYDELSKVKAAISGYKRVKDIMTKQVKIVDEYKRAFDLFKQDEHFTAKEIEYMVRVYTGIVDESLKNLDQLFLVVNALSTEMTDGKRLEIINRVAGAIDENLNDLRDFNSQNVRLSLQRSKDENEINAVKALYDLR
ncbi:MAG: conjugal transfer protein TraI [Terrimonas sp.]|nr:conjugal transfer protein TraI [Terrimonas sp.]OJY92187.1 MAG: conjugal transfer protein TraI [Sphingobacteriales bacterium 40-81]